MIIPNTRLFSFTLIVAMVAVCGSLLGQNKVQQKLPEKTRVLFVLDGSGSMEGLWEGNQSRMDIAKKILTKLVDSLRTNANLELALRVYGHRFNSSVKNCQDTYLEVPFGRSNHTAIINKLKDIKPKGTTPITYSLEQAAKDFPAGPGYRNILILITDGIESCGGDPCAASIAFQRKGIFLRPFIIGLGLDGGKALDCAGKYIDSQNSNSFNDVLNQSIATTLAKTTASILLTNGAGAPRETNINISFLNAMTETSAFEFVHYLNPQGQPDSVQIDPVLKYDIVVNSLPPVVKKDVTFVPGRHNVVTIAVPQGNLLIRSEGRGMSFNAIVREKGKHDILNQQQNGETYRYLNGVYEVEVMTFPRRNFTATITSDKTTTLSIPAPGTVNINTLAAGYGSLFEIMEDGTENWVCKLDETKNFHNYNLLPGNYRLAFRAKGAPGSKYTGIKVFNVASGKGTLVNLFK